MSNCENYYMLLDLVNLGIDSERDGIDEPCEAVDWQNIFELSKSHRVSSLTYKGLLELQTRGELLIDENVLTNWRNVAEQQKIIDFKQKLAFDEIIQTFESEKIPYYPFKGFALKKLYPKNEYREMTDLDFYIPQEAFARAISLLETSNFVIIEQSNKEVVTLEKGALVKIEMQRSFFSGDRFQKIVNYFENCKPMRTKEQENLLHWDITTTYLYLFCHLYKHLKGGGIGIRFLLDLWLFKQNYQAEIDWVAFGNALETTAITGEYQRVQELMVSWFEKEERSQDFELENYVFSSGAFGITDFLIQNRLSEEKNMLRYIMKRLFPPITFFRQLYPTAEISVYVLPYYWTKRALQIVFTKWHRVSYETKVLIQSKKHERDKE